MQNNGISINLDQSKNLSLPNIKTVHQFKKVLKKHFLFQYSLEDWAWFRYFNRLRLFWINCCFICCQLFSCGEQLYRSCCPFVCLSVCPLSFFLWGHSGDIFFSKVNLAHALMHNLFFSTFFWYWLALAAAIYACGAYLSLSVFNFFCICFQP